MQFPDFSTLRLTVCHWQNDLSDQTRRAALEADLGDILTPPVLQHLPEPLHLADAQDALMGWVDARANESDVYLIRNRPSATLVGLLILASFPGTPPQVHLGYLFSETTWGHGYGTEMLEGLVATARAYGPVLLLGGVGKLQQDKESSKEQLQDQVFQVIVVLGFVVGLHHKKSFLLEDT